MEILTRRANAPQKMYIRGVKYNTRGPESGPERLQSIPLHVFGKWEGGHIFCTFNLVLTDKDLPHGHSYSAKVIKL